MTTILQNSSPFLFREDRPTPDPEWPPKDHLQNRFILWLLKYQSIPTDPQGPAYGRQTDQHKVPLLTRKTSKPRTRKMLHSLRFLTPNVKHTLPHIIWAMGQSKKRCWIVSFFAQKQQFVHPFQCLLTKLTLLNTTPFLRYQMKILIFKGILAFHAQQLTGVPSLNTMSLYKFFTEKSYWPSKWRSPCDH
jgi:hypothetical protein